MQNDTKLIIWSDFVSKFIDLTGQRFGNLTVISKDESYIKPSGQKIAMWKCVCDCGNSVSVRSEYLRNGNTTSCGCIEEQERNIIGQRFGRLVVIEQNINNPKSWICQCDCGEKTSVNKSNLILGKTKSCGCLQKEARYAKADDLTGQQFGLLTVIKRVENKGKQIRYLCKCVCGKEKIFYSTNLKRGLSTSCGCFRKEKLSQLYFQDLTGQTFGRLTVESLNSYDRKNNSYFWNCICECGTKTVVAGSHLKNGHTQSCGCMISAGEEKISKILSDNNVIFEKGLSHGLMLPTGGSAKYDFSIFNDNKELQYLIEYDGWQHYIQSNSKWDRDGKFKIRQNSDSLKNQWCIDNNIPLIRIPYTHFSKICIDDLILETTQFLIK